jgi:hypothetical protein
MDAFIVSAYVKKSLQNNKSKKNYEHAAFLINPTLPDARMNDNSMTDNSMTDNSINDNSINSLSSVEDNYRFAENTDNSSNITVNNIKVTNVKKQIVQNEDEEEDDEIEDINNNNKANNISSITFLLMLIINSYSAYLSWECNSNKGYPLVLKVVFSFFAFMFGSLYLLYYILFRFDDCNKF